MQESIIAVYLSEMGKTADISLEKRLQIQALLDSNRLTNMKVTVQTGICCGTYNELRRQVLKVNVLKNVARNAKTDRWLQRKSLLNFFTTPHQHVNALAKGVGLKVSHVIVR